VVGQERMTSMRSDTGRRVQGDGIWPIKRFDARQRVYVGSVYGVLCVYLLCWVSGEQCVRLNKQDLLSWPSRYGEGYSDTYHGLTRRRCCAAAWSGLFTGLPNWI